MAASAQDAHPWPIYNARFRVVFPILDADGDLVTAAAALDSEVSQDQGTFADATNEATEIATSSGIYYLDLIATELDTKCSAIIIKTTTTGAKTTPLVLYPKRLPVLRTGTAQAGAASTITLDSGASADDDFYNGCYVNITNNDPANVLGQARRITDYVGSTKVATIEGTWGTNPSVASTFEILLPGDTVNLAQWAGTAVIDTNTVGVPAVDTVRVAGTAQTAGDIIGDTNDVQARLPAALVGGRMDASVVAMAADTITASAVAVGAIAADAFAAGAIDNAAFNVTETLTANPATGGIVAASFGAGAIDAAALAADAGTEIANAVWDTDATARQTQGSFGQAIGDPVADTNTIYKAVVTDATGATVGVDVVAVQADTDNIQTRLPAALVSGRIDASVGAMASAVVTADAIAADAIGSSELATSAVNEIRDAILPPINTALNNIEFLMVLSSDDVSPGTGLTVTGTRSIDGGAFAAVTGAIAEVANGIYQFDAAAGDMNGTIITFRFAAATANDTFITIKTGG